MADAEPATTAAATPDAASPSAAEPPAPGAHRPTGAINQGPVTYKGGPLDAERGPGLGCFRFQVIALVALLVLTPLSVGRVPDLVTALLLFATLGLLLVSGQTIIFLLRLVAADRRGRREPLAPRTPTVGQIEETDGMEGMADAKPPPDASPPPDAAPPPPVEVAPASPSDPPTDPRTDPPTGGAVRQ